jgi:serine acetyltransferase
LSKGYNMSLKDDLSKDIFCAGRKVSFSSFIILLLTDLGFFCIFIYRIQRILIGIPLLGLVFVKILDLISKIVTSCHISHNAEISGGVYFPHATGIVIGAGAVIKSDVKIYQNVTVGQIRNNYPTIMSGVVIYPNSLILGGVTIEEGAIIGPGLTVRRSVHKGEVIR